MPTIEEAAKALEDLWGTRPYLSLCCAGGSDQTWQAWRDPTTPTPDVWWTGTEWAPHPDA